MSDVGASKLGSNCTVGERSDGANTCYRVRALSFGCELRTGSFSFVLHNFAPDGTSLLSCLSCELQCFHFLRKIILVVDCIQKINSVRSDTTDLHHSFEQMFGTDFDGFDSPRLAMSVNHRRALKLMETS